MQHRARLAFVDERVVPVKKCRVKILRCRGSNEIVYLDSVPRRKSLHG